jgi:hypothetical protein
MEKNKVNLCSEWKIFYRKKKMQINFMAGQKKFEKKSG